MQNWLPDDADPELAEQFYRSDRTAIQAAWGFGALLLAAVVLVASVPSLRNAVMTWSPKFEQRQG